MIFIFFLSCIFFQNGCEENIFMNVCDKYSLISILSKLTIKLMKNDGPAVMTDGPAVMTDGFAPSISFLDKLCQ